MSDDNIGNFLDAEGFGGEDDDGDSDNWKPIKIYGNELFKKAMDILNLTESICDLLPEDEHAEITNHLMLENAELIPATIKDVSKADYAYSIAMESAVIVKVNIIQLMEQYRICYDYHGIEEKYLDIVNEEIEKFKLVFIKWVTSFDKENDLPDEWHIFNNPDSFPDDAE